MTRLYGRLSFIRVALTLARARAASVADLWIQPGQKCFQRDCLRREAVESAPFRAPVLRHAKKVRKIGRYVDQMQFTAQVYLAKRAAVPEQIFRL